MLCCLKPARASSRPSCHYKRSGMLPARKTSALKAKAQVWSSFHLELRYLKNYEFISFTELKCDRD